MLPVQNSGIVTADAASSITFTLNGVAAGNLLVLTVSASQVNSTALTAPVGWSTAEAPVGQSDGGVRFEFAAIYYLENVVGGTVNATINGQAGTFFSGCMTEWAITGTGNLDQHTSNGGTAAISGNTGTTGIISQNNEIVIATVGANNGVNTTGLSSPASSGYASLAVVADDSIHNPHETSYKTVASINTQSGAWTWTNNSGWVAAIATFKIPILPYTLMGQTCL